ncbi:MAG: hypothetical protein VX069_10830 [Cyanobacteriota bacterium]|nr:hypothetical protein [Cyanobacteriota bacterium]
MPMPWRDVVRRTWWLRPGCHLLHVPSQPVENRYQQHRQDQCHQQQERQQRHHPDGGHRHPNAGQQQPDPLGRSTAGQLLHAFRTGRL